MNYYLVWSCRVALVVRHHRHISIMDDCLVVRVAFVAVAATTAHHALCVAHLICTPAPCDIGLVLQVRPTLRPKSAPPHGYWRTGRQCRPDTGYRPAPGPNGGRHRRPRGRGVVDIWLSSRLTGQPTGGGYWKRWGCGPRRRRRRGESRIRYHNRYRRRRTRRRHPMSKP